MNRVVVVFGSRKATEPVTSETGPPDPDVDSSADDELPDDELLDDGALDEEDDDDGADVEALVELAGVPAAESPLCGLVVHAAVSITRQPVTAIRVLRVLFIETPSRARDTALCPAGVPGDVSHSTATLNGCQPIANTIRQRSDDRGVRKPVFLTPYRRRTAGGAATEPGRLRRPGWTPAG
jgi:hypothetical protein